MRRLVVVALLSSSSLAACDRAARDCRDRYAEAQQVVQGVQAESGESLRAALTQLDAAIASCEAAKLGKERSQLEKAKAELAAHLDVLERRRARKSKSKLSPDELEKLVKEGDPSCPKGQAYRNATVSKEIRCTGPQIIDMSRAALSDYFELRGYKVLAESPVRLKIEYGAELNVFTFDEAGGTRGPRCAVLYPKPGMSWEESVARVSGADPEKLGAKATVKAVRGELPVAVESGDDKLIVRIGQCD